MAPSPRSWLSRIAGNSQPDPPPYANTPPTLPTEQMLGRTAPAQDPGQTAPRIGPPLGASGRANFYGLPAYDERNPLLIAGRGLDVFDEMYFTDPHVRRLVLMAWSPLAAATWSLEPYGGDQSTDLDQEVADTVWWGLCEHMSPNFYEHLNELGPVLLRAGFTPFEQIFGVCTYKGKTYLMPRRLDIRLPKTIWRWWQDEYGELTHIGQLLPNKPDVVIPMTEVTYYRLGASGDNWMGTSLLRAAYKPWFMKDRLERIDAIGQERKAVGVPIVYPPKGVQPAVKAEVEAALVAMHVNETAYLIMPGPKAGSSAAGGIEGEGWFVDVVRFDSSSGDSIHKSLDYFQQSVASSFLGDFMQLGHHQVGARATAEVQEDPFLTAVRGLAGHVIPPLQRLINRIVELNWGDKVEGAPKLSITLQDEASLSEIATYVQTLVSSGAMQADPQLEDYLRERADLPPADPDMRKAKQELADASRAATIKGLNNPQPQPDPNAPPNVPAKNGPPKPKPRELETEGDRVGLIMLDSAQRKAGAMVALYPEPADAEQLAIAGGEDPADLHVTLAFCGPAAGLPDTDLLHRAVASFAQSEAPVEAKVTGLGLFTDGDDGPVTYQSIDSPQLPSLHHRLVDHLRAHGIPVAATHGFTPHMTLAYDKRLRDAEPPPGKMLRFARVSSVTGGERRDHVLPSKVKRLDTPAVTAKWWEQLVAKDQLSEAFDGARDSMSAGALPQALTMARQHAHQATNGAPLPAHPPAELVDAVHAEYQRLYDLGHDTARVELDRHRTQLRLDAGSSGAAGEGARRAKARRRAQNTAQSITDAVNTQLRRDQVAGQKPAAKMQASAERAAEGQLRAEAISNAAAQINDGRYDSASSYGAIGGYYTSMFDSRTCEPCIRQDNDELLSLDACAVAVPNPECEGGDRCRCLIVYVMADDSTAPLNV